MNRILNNEIEAIEYLDDLIAKNKTLSIEKNSTIYKGLLSLLIPIKLEVPYGKRLQIKELTEEMRLDDLDSKEKENE